MATRMTGLGRGLDALIRETSNEVATDESPRLLPITDIMPNPHQPRKYFEDDALAELAASIRSQGILQPLLVRPLGKEQPGKYEIVAGERRWRASQLAKLVEVPVVVREFSEEEVLLAALIENLQREDLNPIEEALGIEALRKEFALSQEALAEKLGKSRSAIANSLRLLTLPAEVQTCVGNGALSAGHARSLLAVSDEAARLELQQYILEQSLSVRETEGRVSLWKSTGSFQAGVADASDSASLTSPLASEEGHSRSQVSGRRGPQSERLVVAQKQLSSALAVPVKITGSEDKGKITLSFGSREALEGLLHILNSVGNTHSVE